eukprot:CAMPEP_0175046392 /NCGR_PEP_ID=MMETSP0052_2-20121109/5008_1 /TAXON_ID=51329 ORGANISM="Polytomella parva, Strain SAG 63-3" /NCGR_SAMPLE_ID=MMETSP0052_2 /ASSEMBLY_ACC=CAM_ASM_000194 /LENGTH=614 /DNA_ID=CAMNT_0016310139 /DNA_START=155 /DNA_END=1995 /DNA_ORIENTATION=+
MSSKDARSLQNVCGSASRQFASSEDSGGSSAGVEKENFGGDIEGQANTFFKNYHSRQISLEDMVNEIKALQNSSDSRSIKLFHCLIHNLYDEYKFLHQYPKEHLHLSAELLGSLISHHVIKDRYLKTGLNFVLKALQNTSVNSRRPHDPALNMLFYGLDALRQFASQPQPSCEFYSELLLSKELANEDPELFNLIRKVYDENPSTTRLSEELLLVKSTLRNSNSNNNNNSNNSNSNVNSNNNNNMGLGSSNRDLPKPLNTPFSMGSYSRVTDDDSSSSSAPTVIFSGDSSMSLKGLDVTEAVSIAALRVEGLSLGAMNTESLDSAAEKFKGNFRDPPMEISDRVHFLVNNLTVSNLVDKSEEIRRKVFPKHVEWFVNYMVSKRTAQEANFHQLYMNLLDRLNDKKLYKFMVSTTLYYVKALLYSERIIKESNDRSLLKNLGSWLGLLTFANNKPLLSKDLEVKTIIYEAYERGRLMSVLPFIQKLLECCKDSKVFRPANPMIAGILSVLAELHSMKDLKMNNMFSIELVFRAFGLKPNDVAPDYVLRTLTRENRSNPDWSMPQESMDSKSLSGTPLLGAQGVTALRSGSMGVPPITPPRSSPSPSIPTGAATES